MGLWKEKFTLEGETVKLVPLTQGYANDLWDAANNTEIWTFMATKIHSKVEMDEVIKAALIGMEKKTQYPFVVIHKELGHIIGSTRFIDIQEENKSLEIGWTWYNPAYWRTRINTECKLLLLTHAFENWNMNRVQFKTDSRNIRSQTAIARLGAVREGVLRKDRVLADGFVRDTVVFSIIKEEWAAIKDQLTYKLKK